MAARCFLSEVERTAVQAISGDYIDTMKNIVPHALRIETPGLRMMHIGTDTVTSVETAITTASHRSTLVEYFIYVRSGKQHLLKYVSRG